MSSENKNEQWQPSTAVFKKKDLSFQWLIIHFWAPWNKIDLKMDLNLMKVISQVPDVIEFRSVDIDNSEYRDFIKNSEVGNIPSLGFYNYEKHIRTTIGVSSSDEIIKDIRMWMNTAFFS